MPKMTVSNTTTATQMLRAISWICFKSSSSSRSRLKLRNDHSTQNQTGGPITHSPTIALPHASCSASGQERLRNASTAETTTKTKDKRPDQKEMARNLPTRCGDLFATGCRVIRPSAAHERAASQPVLVLTRGKFISMQRVFASCGQARAQQGC